MLSQDEQIAKFVEAINNNAQKMCKTIEKETLKYFTAEAEKLEKQAKKLVKSRVEYSENEINQAFNKNIAKYKSDLRLSLIKKREGLVSEVFDSVKEKICAFTETQEYISFLQNSLSQMMKYSDGDLTVFAKSGDIEKVKTACDRLNINCVIEEDSTILLGGIKARNQSADKVFDDTLDERINEQKENFLLESGLIIE